MGTGPLFLYWQCTNGMRQTAYEIEVTANNKTVWQSGKVQSSAILLMIGGLLRCFEEKLSNVLFYFSSGFATWYTSDRLFLVIASIYRLNSSLVPYFTERTPSHILLYITCFLAVYAQTERRIFRMAFLLMARISVRSAMRASIPLFYEQSPFCSSFSLELYIYKFISYILLYIEETEVSSGDNGDSFIEWQRFFLLAAEVVSSILHGKNLCYTMKKSLLPCCVNGHKEKAGNL